MDENTIVVRRWLAKFWSFVGAALLFYILIMYGGEKEILTLVIGIVSGTILGGIFGVYFGGTMQKPAPAGQQGTTTADISATVTTTPSREGGDNALS